MGGQTWESVAKVTLYIRLCTVVEKGARSSTERIEWQRFGGAFRPSDLQTLPCVMGGRRDAERFLSPLLGVGIKECHGPRLTARDTVAWICILKCTVAGYCTVQ